MEKVQGEIVNWVPWALSGIGVLLALISLLRTFVVAGRDQSAKIHDDVTKIQERVSLLEMKMGTFWRLVEEHLSTMLKRPTHQEMDDLLDKLRDHTLTLDGAYQLRRWIQQVYMDEQVRERQQRLIATLVLGAINSLITELEHEHAP